MKWIVSQLGAREHYAIPRALAKNNLLEFLVTDIWNHHNIQPDINIKSLKSYLNRYHNDLENVHVYSKNIRFIWSNVLLRIHAKLGWNMQRFHYRQGIKFDAYVMETINKNINDFRNTYFLGFNSTSLNTLKFLKSRNVFTVLDQTDPGLLDLKIIKKEYEKWEKLSNSSIKIYKPYHNRIANEWKIADRVLVNSEWAKNLLIAQGVEDKKLIVVPLAYERNFNNNPKIHNLIEKNSNCLNILYLGSVSLRKGVHYLINAAKELEILNINIRIVGSIDINFEEFEPLPDNVTFYGPVARDEVTKFYNESDIFILPTLSDGFAITQLEAMSHGLPVIVTPNCGKVVDNGRDGFIIEPYSSESIIKVLTWFDRNRGELIKMGINAYEKSTQYSLDNLMNQLLQSIN